MKKNLSFGRVVRKQKEEVLKEVKSYFGLETERVIRKLSEVRGRPMSQLIALLVDRELDKPVDQQFVFDHTFPPIETYEDEYAHEAGLIFKYIRKYDRNGISLDMLMTLRHDIGIEDRERLYRGYQELLSTSLVELFYPSGTRFRYPMDHRHIRVKRK